MADSATVTTTDGSARGGLVRRLSLEAASVPSVRVVDTDPTHAKREYMRLLCVCMCVFGRPTRKGGRGRTQLGPKCTKKCGGRALDHGLPPPPPVRYSILDRPPWYETAILGLQHFLVFIGSTVSMCYISIPPMGGSREDVGNVIATLFFVSGIITLLQTVVGDRLPAVQGGTFAYLSPVAAVTAIVKARGGWSPRPDGTDPERFAATMREVSGACIAAGAIVAGIAASGFLRICLKFISPLVVGSSIAAVGFTLYAAGVPAMAGCWPLSFPMLFFIMLFTLYLRRVRIPVWSGVWLPIFEATPVVLALFLVWAGAGVATAAGAWRNASPDTQAACATSSALIVHAPWVRVPYPGMYGRPTFSAASVVVVLGGAFTAALQSLGDYYLVARASGAPVPPPAVVERAVFVQGLTSLLAGAFPTATGSTVYNENAATLVITRVGARVVVQASAVIAIVIALLPKATAALASIPSAAVAGLFVALFATVSGMGLNLLQFVDMNSARNVMIGGVSIYLSLSVPAFADDPRYAATGGPVATSNVGFNAVCNSLLKAGSVIALIVSLVLDATAPATPAERGLAAWHARHDDAAAWWRVPDLAAVYALPFGVSARVGEARLAAERWVGQRLLRRKKKDDGDPAGDGRRPSPYGDGRHNSTV